MRRQCELLGVCRSGVYAEPQGESEENLALMRELDELYMKWPFYGSRRMTQELKARGYAVNRKRVQRLMRMMGIEAIYPRPRTSLRNLENRVYPYLLRDVAITHVNHVWSTDITYIPLRRGYAYLVAIMDWFSRYVLSWRLSNTMDVSFCIEALQEALETSHPEIFNSDQGSQFTSLSFTGLLEASGIAISMDGRGRALDNVWIERLWRSVKYEDIYIHGYEQLRDVGQGLTRYFDFYNRERRHQSLSYKTPMEVYMAAG